MKKNPFLEKLSQPEYVFLMVSSITGVILLLLIPNQAGFDETQHLIRAWEISGKHFFWTAESAEGSYFPVAFLEISYTNQYFYDPVPSNYFYKYWNKKIDWNLLVRKLSTQYSPNLYLPQAFMMGLLGRLTDQPVLLIFYAGRALYLIGYIILTFLAIRLLPFGKWILVTLGLAPMAMFQAATFFPDAYTNGAAFLFIAWMTKLATTNPVFTWRHFWISLAIITLLFSVKIQAFFLIPLFLVFWQIRYQNKKILLLLSASSLLLFLVLAIGLGVVAPIYAFRFVASNFFSSPEGYSPFEQLEYILLHPINFAETFLRYLSRNAIPDLIEWIAAYGYGDQIVARVPGTTYFFWLLAFLTGWVASESRELQISSNIRRLLAFTGLTAWLTTIISSYALNEPVGSSSITVYGRYLTAWMPALLIAATPQKLPKLPVSHGWFRLISVIAATASLIVYSLGIYLSFYTYCGSTLYNPGLCYQPRYKNWEPETFLTPPVTRNIVLQQQILPVCEPIYSIRLWTNHVAQTPSGKTFVSLVDSENRTILQAQIDNALTPDFGWYEISFPPIDNLEGKVLTIQITSDVLEDENALSFSMSLRREYLYGLYVNNKPIEHDLLFQYGCKRLTLFDLIKLHKQ